MPGRLFTPKISCDKLPQRCSEERSATYPYLPFNTSNKRIYHGIVNYFSKLCSHTSPTFSRLKTRHCHLHTVLFASLISLGLKFDVRKVKLNVRTPLHRPLADAGAKGPTRFKSPALAISHGSLQSFDLLFGSPSASPIFARKWSPSRDKTGARPRRSDSLPHNNVRTNHIYHNSPATKTRTRHSHEHSRARRMAFVSIRASHTRHQRKFVRSTEPRPSNSLSCFWQIPFAIHWRSPNRL